MTTAILPDQKIRALVPVWLAQAEGLSTNEIEGKVLAVSAKSIKVWLDKPVAGKVLWLAFSLINSKQIEVEMLGANGATKVVEQAAPAPNPHPDGRLYVEDGDIIVAGAPYEMRTRLKMVVGGRWNKPKTNPPTNAWYYPKSPSTALALYDALQDTRIQFTDAEFLRLVEQGRIADKASDLKLADETALAQPTKINKKLWLHQLRAFHFARALMGAALFMAMGTGKSLTTIALLLELGIQRTLVCCPKNVVSVWPREFKKHSAVDAIVVPLDKGSVAKKVEKAKKALEEGARTGKPVVIVINYESAWRFPFGAELTDSGRLTNLNGFAVEAGFQALICDESHRLKSPKSRAARFLQKLGAVVNFKLLLTGTPMPHDPFDIWSQFMILDGGATFGKSFAKFKERYGIQGGYMGYQTVGYKNLEELQDKMYRSAFRVTEDVVELPEKVFAVRTAELSPAESAAYEQMEKELELAFAGDDGEDAPPTSIERQQMYDQLEVQFDLGEIDLAEYERRLREIDAVAGAVKSIVASNVLVQLLKLAQITSGFVTDSEGHETVIGDSKLKLLADVVEDLGPDEPFVVFARFKNDMDRIVKMLRETDRGDGQMYRVGELRGGKSDLVAWQDGKFQALVVQLQSGGVGVDFTKCGDKPCRYCIYYGKDFNWGNYEQSLKRIHRPGQTETTIFITLAMEETIDLKIEDVLETRGNLVEAVLTAGGLAGISGSLDEPEAAWGV